MERSEYHKLDHLEDRIWWFAASHKNLLTLSWRQVPLDAGPILDAGCGTGGFLAQLAALYPNRALRQPVGLSACSRKERPAGMCRIDQRTSLPGRRICGSLWY